MGNPGLHIFLFRCFRGLVTYTFCHSTSSVPEAAVVQKALLVTAVVEDDVLIHIATLYGVATGVTGWCGVLSISDGEVMGHFHAGVHIFEPSCMLMLLQPALGMSVLATLMSVYWECAV